MKDPLTCPACKNRVTNVEIDFENTDDSTVLEQAYCTICGKSWTIGYIYAYRVVDGKVELGE